MEAGNEFSKVVLLNLPIKNYEIKEIEEEIGYNPSMGLLSLGTWLELNGYPSVLIDLCFERLVITELLNKIKEISPIIVGLSVYTVNINTALAVAKALKHQFPTIKIVMGGPHPTLALDDAISSEYVDFVIRKEGESSFLELLEAIISNETKLRYEDIKGLVFKKDGIVKINSLRQPIRDLDIMPIIKRELYDFNKYKNIINIITSRGCPGNCIYCAGTALSGVNYRMRDISNVFLEIVYLKTLLKEKVRKIFIVDDTFTAISERVSMFVELIKMYNVDLTWRFQSRVDVITEDLLEKVASIGCVQILYGIESGSQLVLDQISKDIDLETSRKVIELTYNKNILPELSFIIGHYCDTKETMEETFNFIKEMSEKYSAEISLFYNIPYPGTRQYINREKLGLKIKVNNYNLFNGITPIVESTNFSLNDQKVVFNKAKKYLWRISSARLLRSQLIEKL
jgi:anaerobic magnesium-protoporphyrin IX monomethyl ester cyclase